MLFNLVRIEHPILFSFRYPSFWDTHLLLRCTISSFYLLHLVLISSFSTTPLSLSATSRSSSPRLQFHHVRPWSTQHYQRLSGIPTTLPLSFQRKNRCFQGAVRIVQNRKCKTYDRLAVTSQSIIPMCLPILGLLQRYFFVVFNLLRAAFLVYSNSAVSNCSRGIVNATVFRIE